MEQNARMAALALHILGEATLALKGKDVPGYVAVHNWLEDMRAAPEQQVEAKDQSDGISEELPDAERQAAEG